MNHRVCLITYQSFHRGEGGGTLYASTLARWLRDQGYDVTLLARSPDAQSHTQTIDGIHVVELNGTRIDVIPFARLLDKDLGFAYQVRQYLQQHGNDFSILHTIIPDITGFIPRFLRGRTVVSVIEDFWTPKPTRLQEFLARYQRVQVGIAIRECFHVTIPSETSDVAFRNWFPHAENRWTVVQDFVDAELFQPQGPNNEDLVKRLDSRRPQLFVPQRAVNAKRVDTAIRALPTILKKYPDTQMVISGGGPLESSLRALAIELNVDDHVMLLGSVSYERDMPTLYRIAEVVIITSSSEGAQPSPTASEAMATGTPVVMTTACDTANVFTNIVPMYNAGDDAQLAEHVIHVLDDPQTSRQHANQSRDLILQRFSQDAFLERFGRIYRELDAIER